jgi:hypothetical protein
LLLDPILPRVVLATFVEEPERERVYAEPEYVNVQEAQESIPLTWVSIPGLLKRFTNTGSDGREIMPFFL